MKIPRCFPLFTLMISVVMFAARPAAAYVMSGLEVMEKQNFAQLEGKNVGIITNHTGIDHNGRSGVDVLFNAPNVRLKAIFCPEHGFRGSEEGGTTIHNSTDPATGLPIYSLYGKTTRPTSAMLAGIDVLVFDIQDVGARFYTYLTTMALCMEEAAKRGISFVVLDRPNPIGGTVMEGPMIDPAIATIFTGYFPVPVRHGLTAGEMALLHKDRKKLDLDLSIVSLQGWDRGMYYDQTGLTWVNPSPNIRNVISALMYPGIGGFENTNVSVGRGTDTQFDWFGAPWLNAERLAATLNAYGLKGVRFRVENRTPVRDMYKGRLCRGIRIEVTDMELVRPMDIFVVAICAMRDKTLYGELVVKQFDRLTAGHNVFRAVYQSADSPEKIIADFAAQCKGFGSTRTKYLLY